MDLYRAMVLLRTSDERSVVYLRQGRIGTYAIFWGHEAIQAGSALALADEDWIFPSYRESAIGLLRGMPPETVLAWWRGHPAGWWDPREFRLASITVPIATHVPHAAGYAWGAKLKGESACAIAYFGDGATSEGAFHERANFAAVMRAPVVLLCNNNQWAISTPLERDPCRVAGRQGRGLRHAGRPLDAATCWRSTKRPRRPSCAHARVRGRRSSMRSPTGRLRTPRRTTPAVLGRGACRGVASERMRGALRELPAARGRAQPTSLSRRFAPMPSRG